MILTQVPECDVVTWPEVANNAMTAVLILGVTFALVWFVARGLR